MYIHIQWRRRTWWCPSGGTSIFTLRPRNCVMALSSWSSESGPFLPSFFVRELCTWPPYPGFPCLRQDFRAGTSVSRRQEQIEATLLSIRRQAWVSSLFPLTETCNCALHGSSKQLFLQEDKSPVAIWFRTEFVERWSTAYTRWRGGMQTLLYGGTGQGLLPEWLGC